MRQLTLREHGSLTVGVAGPNSVTADEAKSVHQAQEASGLRAFEWWGPSRIKAAQFVGVLATPLVTIEVIPKVGGIDDDRGVRDLLVSMLLAAWDVPVSDGAATDHRHQSLDILERLIGIFATRLFEQARRGLTRAYLERADDLPRLRGRLDVRRQFTTLAADPSRLACRYDEFEIDTPLNRLLACTVAVLHRRSRADVNRRILRELGRMFEDVHRLTPHQALAQSEELRLDRTARRWRDLAVFARLFLRGSYQTTSLGEAAGITLLFDMNRLFESYVAVEARRALGPLGFRVRAQGPTKHLARTEQEAPVFRTQPDITIGRPGQSNIVLDTKWKHLDSTKANGGVTQADAYQMFAYASVYAADDVMLIYPADDPARAGLLKRFTMEADNGSLSVATLALSPSTPLAPQILSLVLSVERRSTGYLNASDHGVMPIALP